MRRRGIGSVVLMGCVAACSTGARPADGGARDSAAAGAAARAPRDSNAVATVRETFITPFDSVDNIDSPAVYHGSDGSHWVLATAKTSNAIVVYDAGTGQVVRRFGTSGDAPGALRRPNGITVIDSLLFVVERDNHRVQAFALPTFAPLGTFGAKELRKPYGIAWVADSTGWRLFVTDNYETAAGEIPPDRELGARVKEFHVGWRGGRLITSFVRAFGDTTAAGALRTVESIEADVPARRLLIAEETPIDSHIKVYDFDGTFTGTIVGRGRFPQQAEGIVLYACGDTDGYWITTDQGDGTNTFHVFDRRTLAHVGAFSGATTRRTDGVALTQATFGPFSSGAFYASHLDGALGAMAWSDIAAALGLRSDCGRG